MQKTYLIKVYHSFDKWIEVFKNFLDDVGKTVKRQKMILGLNYARGQFYYSYSSDETAYSYFENQFYSSFNKFQIQADDDNFVWKYNQKRTVVWELRLENSGFFPFKYRFKDKTDFVYNIFRSFENLDVVSNKAGIFIEMDSINEESLRFFLKSKLSYFLFRIKLGLHFFKYILNFKISGDWKKIGHEYYKEKLNQELFSCKIFIVMQGSDIQNAEAKLHAIFNNFRIFKNYPLNKFNLKIHKDFNKLIDIKTWKIKLKKNILSSEEISSFLHFPQNPKNETSLLKVTARKLTLPIGVPTFPYTQLGKEILPAEYPKNTNILWISDFRSIRVPIGIYDEDRLRHIYVVWKTWVWKSKFLSSILIDDLKQGKGIGLIDPHGDLIEEIFAHIPKHRKDDVIVFDPTDEAFPFCLNPLDVQSNESKQILAKWFIDIFKKFFWANWNAKLEHVLRMVFLALLDKPDATLFDIIRALTDKDFRYDMIESVGDDVVRNFWTNEFAGWSQQFNTEAIMPILNKVGQLLSVDILKNIFSSKENKLDFRKAMDENKILLIKLPKWKLQSDIMGFLWAMFVTKIFQAAMSRQSLAKDQRTPFYLYVDEFQNFATDTFNEILSEARKYWLGLVLAHQFIKQIPSNISDSLFWNVGTLVSFRISSEDAQFMKQQFDPFLEAYDLANLSQREAYCKMIVRWEVKDPFSIRTLYTPDAPINPDFIESIYNLSRSKYSRSLFEAKQKILEEHKDVVEKIEGFSEPIM